MPLTAVERQAMQRALLRAAEKFDQQAAEMEDRVARRRKGHGGLESAEVMTVLREVSRKLRAWARACGEGSAS